MNLAEIIRYRKARKQKLRRKATTRDEIIATTTFGAGKALHYGLISITELAELRKKCCMFCEDIVVRGEYLIKWDGEIYKVMNMKEKRFPIVMSADEFKKVTGNSPYSNMTKVKSCK